MESQEPVEEDKEDDISDTIELDCLRNASKPLVSNIETDVPQNVTKSTTNCEIYRRLSSSFDSCSDGQCLSVPNQPITASSSAETLTDNTITAPPTPTSSTQG